MNKRILLTVFIITCLFFPHQAFAKGLHFGTIEAIEEKFGHLSLTRTSSSTTWQRYRMRYVIRIGGVSKLWMPVPREWDGIGMTNVQVLEVFPPPPDRYRDANGNEIAFWQTEDQSSREYGIVFEVNVQPVAYEIDPDNLGQYDTASELYQRCTRPSAWIQSDHAEIIAQAREIVGNEANPYRQARLVHSWVAQSIQSGPAVDALTALRTRKGDCAAHACLVVAMLRSLGVPARPVSGLHTAYTGTFESGSFQQADLYTHVWAEFYLSNDGWIQLDASAGDQNFAGIGEPRIILSRGDDIELGHGYPQEPLVWFHVPHSDLMTGSTPPTQNAGEELRLEVETNYADSDLILRYEIAIAEPLETAQTAHVKIDVEQCTRSTLVLIVGWYYNSNDKRNFTNGVAPNISNLVAHDSSGNSLPIVVINSRELLESFGWSGSGAWELDMQGNATATIEFDELLSGNYNALDMFPINQAIDEISVKFDFPDRWLPVTVWTPINDFEFSVPKTRNGLLGNFSVADIAARRQNDSVQTTVRDGTTFIFYSEPFSSENINYTLSVWSYLKSIHGGYPYDRYSFLGGGLHYLRQTQGFLASSNQGWAWSFDDSGLDSPMDYMMSSYTLGYRKFGKYICSGFHELSHSWNVWQFRDHSNGGAWFHDGIANYFEAVGPRDVFGLDQLYRAWLYQAWDFYQEKDGTQYDIPLVELEHQWDNGDLTWSLMIYFKGALFYYMLDKECQEAGNNFYDFTTSLYEKFPPDSNPGTVEDFVQSAELFAGKDLTNFFNAYFFGNEDYPLRELDAYEKDYQEVFGSQTGERASSAPLLQPKFSLSQNYPNPCNPETTIEYSLAESCNVTLKIYNLSGQLIKTLINEYQEPGFHKITWYGNNNAGQEVASGVYFYRIKAGDFVSTQKMVVLK